MTNQARAVGVDRLVIQARRLASRTWTRVDDSTGGRLHRGSAAAAAAPVCVYTVYRRRNAEVVRALVDTMPAGSTAAMHALDEPSPLLRRWTVSHGAGDRMPLLDRLILARPPGEDQPVLLADDDVVLAGSGLPGFLRIARAAGLDLAMPAHDKDSNWTFRVTCRRPFSTVRRTHFVEVGPVLLVSPRAFRRIHPFPDTARMGWGLDVRWSALAREGLRLGIVDAVPMRHLGAVGTAYDRAHEVAEVERHSAEAGVASAYELARETGEVWRPWARHPPWPVEPPTSRGDDHS